MNIDRKLTMTCQYEESVVEDEEFMTEKFLAPREIKCFKWGKLQNIITADSVTRLSDKEYMVKENIKLGDKLDGQLVISIDEPPELIGTVPFVVARVAANV